MENVSRTFNNKNSRAADRDMGHLFETLAILSDQAHHII
jgi:hypothetical protein